MAPKKSKSASTETTSQESEESVLDLEQTALEETPEQPLTPEELSPEEQKISDEILQALSQHSTDIIVYADNSKRVSREHALAIMERIARTKEIDRSTAIMAVGALFRRGAANAGAPDSMEIDVKCPHTNTVTIVTRYDIIMALHAVTGHKTIRKLAEVMAPEMLQANLYIIQKQPLYDLKGDLANRINRKLSFRKEPALTRKEEVCCATYANWMPNLNELAKSTRLKSLLDEDLNARRKRNSGKGFNKPKAKQVAKGENKNTKGGNNQKTKK